MTSGIFKNKNPLLRDQCNMTLLLHSMLHSQ